MSHIFHQVSRFFASESLNVSHEWLEACLSWCQEQGVSNLKDSTYAQWLDTDISIEGTQERPLFLSSLLSLESKLEAGKYTVQVQSSHDIGSPAYSQLHKLKKSNLENASVSAESDDKNFKASWQPKSSRMLYFVFHDGFRIFKGIEHESLVNVLPDPIPPGLKVTLIGPLVIRRGIILLVKGSVKVLGGHVEELLTNNSQEKVLTDLLENPQSQTEGQKFPKCRTFEGKPSKIKFIGSLPSSSSSKRSFSQRPKLSSFKTPNPFDDDEDDIFSEMPIPEEAGPFSTPAVGDIELFEDDFFSEAMPIPKKEASCTKSSPDIVRDEGPRVPLDDISDNSNFSATANDFNVDFTDDEQVLLDEGPLSRTQSIIRTLPLKPFQYLAMATREYGEVITVKVCITTLSSKLSMKSVETSAQRNWHINVIVTDGSDTMEAEISHKILTKWIGFTPTEYAFTCKNHPERKEEMKANISSISNKLLTFNGLMKIKFHSREDTPVITEVCDINPGHLQQFKKRQK